MMRPDKIDALINNAEINALADLFLSRYGFDLGSAQYRQFRNAIVLFSYGTSLTVDDILRLIADCDGISHGALVRGLKPRCASSTDPFAKPIITITRRRRPTAGIYA